jgi:hypothetical protein
MRWTVVHCASRGGHQKQKSMRLSIGWWQLCTQRSGDGDEGGALELPLVPAHVEERTLALAEEKEVSPERAARAWRRTVCQETLDRNWLRKEPRPSMFGEPTSAR